MGRRLSYVQAQSKEHTAAMNHDKGARPFHWAKHATLTTVASVVLLVAVITMSPDIRVMRIMVEHGHYEPARQHDGCDRRPARPYRHQC